jgi:hypothetical protein
MTRLEPLQITYGGRIYNASYRVQGAVVSVESAYGSRSVDLKGRSDAKTLAEAALRDLVEAWRCGGTPMKKARRRTLAGDQAQGRRSPASSSTPRRGPPRPP